MKRLVLMVMSAFAFALALWIWHSQSSAAQNNLQINSLVLLHHEQASDAEKLCNCEITALSSEKVTVKLNDNDNPNNEWTDFAKLNACGLLVKTVTVTKLRHGVSIRVSGYPFSATDCNRLKDIRSMFPGIQSL